MIDFNKPMFRDVMIASTAVSIAAAAFLAWLGPPEKIEDVCAPLVIPAPEILRPQASDKMERLPFTFTTDDSSPEIEAMDDAETPRHRRHHRRRG